MPSKPSKEDEEQKEGEPIVTKREAETGPRTWVLVPLVVLEFYLESSWSLELESRRLK